MPSKISLFLISAVALCAAFVPRITAQSSEPLKTVVPVNLDASTGNISIGNTTYPGTNPGLNILALVRQPDINNPGVPKLIQQQTFTDPGSANEFLQNVLSNHPDALLLIDGVGNYGFGPAAIATNLHSFGAAHDIDSISAAIPFVFVANGGMNIAQAHQVGSSASSTTGYLATDTSGNYAFIQTDYVRFDIGLSGTIQIGSKAYTVANSYKRPNCDGSDSFRLVVVQRASLDSLVANNTYCTGRVSGEFDHLEQDLQGVIGHEDQIAFFASNGHPIPPDWNFGTDGDPRISPLAVEIAQLGGFWETIAYMTPSDTYSLVGSGAPPSYIPKPRRRARESSSLYPDHPTGELHGVLARGRGNWYSPISSNGNGKTNLDFYKILGQSPVAFPHPNSTQELAAFQYIGQQLYQLDGAVCASPCNVRNSYADTNKSISAWLTNLRNITDANNDDCSQTKNQALPFCVVKAQLAIEFAYVLNIRNLNNNLGLLWTASGTNLILALDHAYNDVTANLPPPPPQSRVPGIIDASVNFFSSLASNLPGIGPVIGLADTVFNFATALTNDPMGNRALSVTSTVAGLEQQAAQNFNQQAAVRGVQFNFIYQDWGKLSALGIALEEAQPGSPWYWDSSTTTSQILTAMSPAMEQSFYQSLLAALYAVGSYVPGGWGLGPSFGQTPIWQQPASYGANADNSDGEFAAQPFNISGDSWYVPYTYPTDPNSPYTDPTQPTSTLLGAGGWLGIGLQTDPGNPTSGTGYLYQPPAVSISSHLFTPVSGGGLGVYRPAFFESWPFPRLTCDASSYEGDPGQGCNWGSAAPAPESAPTPLTSLSISLGKSRNKTGIPGELDIPINIANSGTVDAQAIEITQVTLRTLAGSGQAVLVDPLPLRVGLLKTGTFATTTLHIRVPPTVLKLVVTENGSIDSGERSPYNFSFGQAFFPQSQK
jgi:hypothetical protein